MVVGKSIENTSPVSPAGGDIILAVDGLQIEFGTQAGAVCAVADLSFDLRRDKTLAIVGESGSGKSVSALAVLGLVKHIGGRVAGGRLMFQSDAHGRAIDLAALDERDLRVVRGSEIAMIFQEPMTSLNPVFTIGSQIVETLTLHRGISRGEARARARDLLDLVRLPNAGRLLDSYPHQLSGGMRQRAMIAMALSCQPKVLIADEPTTALDVTVQAQILHIIRELQAEFQTAVIFISHDMGVVSEMADDVLVMRHGARVALAPAVEIFKAPQAAYTRALLAAVPKLGSMTGTTHPELFHLPDETGNKVQPDGDLKPAGGGVSEPVIEVRDLTTRYDIRGGLLNRVTHRVHAAESVSFTIHAGETLALVGESGSGKSTVGKTIQQLVEPVAGEVRFRGREILSLPKAERKRFRREIQYVFQDPYGSLNPRKSVGASIIEPALTHGLIRGGADIRARVTELLEKVGLEAGHAERYPHEFSGGQRQRVCIARALACDPRLIIADEAVSALDVSVQAQVINLLMKLQAETGLAYLFITHDMAVVERVSHRVAVMYLGQLVEIGTRAQIFETPHHPYTKRLLAAVPVIDPASRPTKPPLEGEIPSPIRRIGDEPQVHEFHQIETGHFVASDATSNESFVRTPPTPA